MISLTCSDKLFTVWCCTVHTAISVCNQRVDLRSKSSLCVCANSFSRSRSGQGFFRLPCPQCSGQDGFQVFSFFFCFPARVVINGDNSAVHKPKVTSKQHTAKREHTRVVIRERAKNIFTTVIIWMSILIIVGSLFCGILYTMAQTSCMEEFSSPQINSSPRVPKLWYNVELSLQHRKPQSTGRDLLARTDREIFTWLPFNNYSLTSRAHIVYEALLVPLCVVSG